MAEDICQRKRYLCFHCPFCCYPLDRLLDVGVVRMELEFRCPNAQGCGRIIQLTFHEYSGCQH